MGTIVSVLTAWCDNCDSMLTNIETQVSSSHVTLAFDDEQLGQTFDLCLQVDKVNKEKTDTNNHKAALEQKIKYVLAETCQDGDCNWDYFSDVKQQIKNQPSGEDGDPDSRMETERMDRRDKKAAKGKGLRGSSKSGGKKKHSTSLISA